MGNTSEVDNPQRRLESIRSYELASIRSYFRSDARVLELGGSHGFQASVVKAWGCDVFSLDIKSPKPDSVIHHPVTIYDGVNIPLPDQSVDLVFSSNVLEHVDDLKGLLRDTRRVLRKGGRCIHVLPTPSWRIWTSLAGYAFALKILATGKQVKSTWGGTSYVKERGLLQAVLKRGILGPPHGNFSSAAAEIVHFSRSRWTNLFKREGFRIIRCFPMGLLYSGYGIFPRLSFASRRILSLLLGSATQCYVLEPA